MSSYQTIVLSGGGAKGPYGLGVLLALDKWHTEHTKRITKIYCGTSVGALNATRGQGEEWQADLVNVYHRNGEIDG